jgi:hypothetical protein
MAREKGKSVTVKKLLYYAHQRLGSNIRSGVR